MKENVLYTCEYCGTSYTSKDEAMACEKNHKVITETEAIEYKMLEVDKTGYPVVVRVKFNDGKEMFYKRY